LGSIERGFGRQAQFETRAGERSLGQAVKISATLAANDPRDMWWETKIDRVCRTRDSAADFADA
jgi:hypothetical protein